jgi:hypothetical protein
VGQVNGDYEAKEEQMQWYLNLVKHQMSKFQEVRLTCILREQNVAADQLARLASLDEPNEKFKVVQQSSIQTMDVNSIETETETSWMTPIISYLQGEILPNNHHEVRRIKVRASRFIIL